MKIVYPLLLLLLTSCHITIKDKNVCPDHLRPIIEIQNYLGSSNDYATLSKIDINNSDIKNFESSPNYIRNYNNEHTHVDFDVMNNKIEPQNYYKLTYNDDVYFIYDINLANNSYHSMCDRETTYKINDCDARGYNIDINPSCAIPVEQADSYFEKVIKPFM